MLGGKSILKQVELGNIKIDPAPQKAGPNSIDVTLGNELAMVIPNAKLQNIPVINTRQKGAIEKVSHTDCGGFVLMPHELYLGYINETVGSNYFAPMIEGRSTAARHGLMVHVAAGFCDAGWVGRIVLEIQNVTRWPMIVYPGDRIAQVYFERVEGEYDLYDSTYQGQTGIVPAKGLAE